MTESRKGPGDPGWTPRKSIEVTLHKVESAREGTRYVLKSERTGDYFDLPGGEQDAFVWARLDGRSTIGTIGQLHLEEFGSIHPDLAGLLRRLNEHGMLDDQPRKPAGVAGRRLTDLAAKLVMIRLPIPATEPLWRHLGKLAAPLYSAPAGALAVVVGIAGLVLALGPWKALAAPTLLLQWPLAGAASLLAGVGVLLLVNLLVDLFEAVAQVSVLARGGRPPGRIGLSFDMGVPGIYIETPDEILLPLELRGWLLLAPLLAASFVGGVATIALWRVGWATPGDSVLVPLILHKVAWVAWLRSVVHANPLGPSPFYDALCAWWSQPRLRSLALKALRGRVVVSGHDDGISRREVAVLSYVGLAIAYFVVLARLGTFLLHGEIMPQWNEAMATANTPRVIALALLLMMLGLPTLLALGGGLLMSLQAAVRAIARSDLFPTTGRLAVALGALALLAAVSPRILAGPIREPVQTVLLWVAAFLAGVALAEGLRLRTDSGDGWGAMGGVILTLVASLLAGLLVLLIMGVAMSTFVELAAGLATLGVGLGFYSWALLETFRAWRAPPWLPLLGVVCLPVGMLPGAEHSASPMAGPLVLPALCLLGLTGVLGAGAWLRARGSFREAGLAMISLSAVALGGGFSSWWFSGQVESLVHPPPGLLGGVHMPLLGAALLATGTWLLRRGRRERPRLPDVSRALAGETVEEREVAACSFVLEGLYLGVRDVFGRGTAAAVARMMEAEQQIHIEVKDGETRLWCGFKGETPREHAWRFRFAVADLFRLAGDRVGDQFCEYLLGHVVARLPAAAHETIASSGPSTLPVLGSVLEVPTDTRLELLRQAVPFTDFDLHSLRALGDLVGIREFAAGEVIIVQGDVGDAFYMLARGTARVYLEDASGEERAIATLRPGDAFGEAALLRHEPRSASVVAEEPCLALTLDRGVFGTFMQSHKELLAGVFARQEDLRLLREVPLFAGLTGVQVTVLCRRLRPMEVKAGEAVITLGEPGDRFYLIREGAVEVRVPQEGSDEMQTVAQLRRGEYFGEIALLNDTPRTATVVATQRSELLALERDDFHALLGGSTGERLARRSLERMKDLQASSATPRRILEESSDS